MNMRCIVVAMLTAVPLCLVDCIKDYNPYENYANVNVQIDPATSKRLHNGDTLPIFATETLVVYTTVSEKMDSFVVTTSNNRYFTDTLFKPPFSAGNYYLLFSFYDTGKTSINVKTYRSNQTKDSLPTITLYVDSLRIQKDIDIVFGAADSLRTNPVNDWDVMYVWAFGKDTVYGRTNAIPIPYSELYHVVVGQQDTGHLWVMDFLGTFRSPTTSFKYLFFEPVPPKIKCTTKGLSHDTVITADTTLTFTFQVIDSSGRGLAEVLFDGKTVQTSNDSASYYATVSGMLAYSSAKPKMVPVSVANNLGETTIDTFYLCYESTGLHGDLAVFRLANPTSPTLTTRVDTLFYVVNVDNYSHDSINVSTQVTGPGGNPASLSTVYSYADSTRRCTWFVPLSASTGGLNTIRTQVLIPSRPDYSAETTLVVTRNLLAPDTTPPVITAITVNGKSYPLDYNKGSVFSVDSASSVIVGVSAFDNESGVDSVSIVQGATAAAGTTYPTKYSNHVWTSPAIPFPTTKLAVSQTMILWVVVRNKLLIGAASVTTTQKAIYLKRNTSVVTPLQ